MKNMLAAGGLTEYYPVQTLQGYRDQTGNLNRYTPTITIGQSAPAMSFSGNQLSSLTSGLQSGNIG